MISVKEKFIASGQVFEIPPGTVDQISVINNYAKTLSSHISETNVNKIYTKNIAVAGSDYTISYLIMPKIVHIGVFNENSGEFEPITNPTIFEKVQSSLRTDKYSAYQLNNSAADLRLYKAWGKEIVRRRERDIVLEPTVEVTGDKKHDNIANLRWREQEKNIPYGHIDAEMHTMKRPKQSNDRISYDFETSNAESPTFTMICGIPGSGKAKQTKFKAEELKAKGYEQISFGEIDSYVGETPAFVSISSQEVRAEGGDRYWYNNNLLFSDIRQRVKYALEHGVSVIYNATNVRELSRRPFLEIAKEYGCKTEVIVVTTKTEIALERCKAEGSYITKSELERKQYTLSTEYPDISEGWDSIKEIGVKPSAKEIGFKKNIERGVPKHENERSSYEKI